MMNENFIRNRITSLRLKKGVSEYRMSTDLGHSRSYIANIASGRTLPSLTELLYICDYFQIAPKDFFDEGIENPELVNAAQRGIQTLDESDLRLVIGVIQRLNRQD